MIFNPNGFSTFIMVTLLTVIMVVLLPAIDYFVCKKAGLSLSDGVSQNPDADILLRYRKLLLVLMFLLYLFAAGYVTFFSRSAAEDYRIHAMLFKDLANSVSIDYGFFDAVMNFFVNGYTDAMKYVHIVSTDNIAQVYMNVMLFIPMGYLLPYVFDWYRRDVSRRTILTCIAATFFIENTQLITKMGFYDVDDLAANSLGGIIGQGLYIAVAYVLTHPSWRQELKHLRSWRRNAKDKALFPFFSRMHITRATVCCNDQKAVTDFLMNDLGFYLRKTITATDTWNLRLLLQCGKTDIEVICLKKPMELPPQRITIAANNSEHIRDNLIKKGIPVSGYEGDALTGLRTFSVEGPEQITIMFIEE